MGELRERIFREIDDERGRQDAKWGDDAHMVPSVDPVLMNRQGGCDGFRMCEEYEIPSEPRAKFKCETAHERGQCTFAHIAVEELAEAVFAATEFDDGAARAELVQLAAVVVKWIEGIDRRQRRG